MRSWSTFLLVAVFAIVPIAADDTTPRIPITEEGCNRRCAEGLDGKTYCISGENGLPKWPLMSNCEPNVICYYLPGVGGTLSQQCWSYCAGEDCYMI